MKAITIRQAANGFIVSDMKDEQRYIDAAPHVFNSFGEMIDHLQREFYPLVDGDAPKVKK